MGGDQIVLVLKNIHRGGPGQLHPGGFQLAGEEVALAVIAACGLGDMDPEPGCDVALADVEQYPIAAPCGPAPGEPNARLLTGCFCDWNPAPPRPAHPIDGPRVAVGQPPARRWVRYGRIGGVSLVAAGRAAAAVELSSSMDRSGSRSGRARRCQPPAED